MLTISTFVLPIGHNHMMAPTFLTEDKPIYGKVERLSPFVRRIVAHNPSHFTYHGTGTFLVGAPNSDRIAIIDAGPNDELHVEAVLEAVRNQKVTHLLVTHTHPDHSPATSTLKEATGATTFGFGPHPKAAIQTHNQLERAANKKESEIASENEENSGDLTFVPDIAIKDGDLISGHGFRFECIHTPGHISNHICYAFLEERTLFSGDHVMGWSTSVIPAPDGDMNDYLASLNRLIGRNNSCYRPTHGPPIHNPDPYVKALVRHREKRERQILDTLFGGPRSIETIVSHLYADISEDLHKAAAASVHAHLISLERSGQVTHENNQDQIPLWGLA